MIEETGRPETKLADGRWKVTIVSSPMSEIFVTVALLTLAAASVVLAISTIGLWRKVSQLIEQSIAQGRELHRSAEAAERASFATVKIAQAVVAARPSPGGESRSG